MSTPVVFYNADLVEQAGADPDAFPNDWDSPIGLAGAIDALGQGVDGMYYELGVDDWTTQGLILNFGGAMMTADETDIAFDGPAGRSEAHTSELQSLMRISYAALCFIKII